MPFFRRKPSVVRAHRWHKNGDHPLDYSVDRPVGPSAEERRKNGWEGDIVRYYRHPRGDGQERCDICDHIMHDHGWIDSGPEGHIVCPGDWIIEEDGEYYPCGNEVFLAVYEEVEVA